MAKVKLFFTKIGKWLSVTFSKVWKWCLANKVLAGIIAGGVLASLTIAIVVPISVSASRKKQNENQSQLVGGDSNSPSAGSHTHTYSSDWSKDETYHWHASTCEHSLKKDESAHTFSDWQQDSDDTSKDVRNCSVCGYLEQRTHQHSMSSAWSYNEEYHWHASTCSHTDVKTDYNFHTYQNDSFTVLDHVDTEYTYKYTQCSSCGLYLFRYVDLNGEVNDEDGSVYDEWVVDLKAPTKTETGWIKYFPSSLYHIETTIELPKLGDDRFDGTTYHRPYTRYIKGTKLFAKLNPSAFTDTTDNEIIASILSAGNYWSFEIDDDTYDALKLVDSIYWGDEPDYSHEGQIIVEYDDGTHDSIEVNGWGSTNEWITPAQVQNKGSHQDKITYHQLKEDGASLEDSDVYHNDLYVRARINEALEEELVVLDYDHSNHATYCTLKVTNSALVSGKIRLLVEVQYGCYQQSNTFYFFNSSSYSIVSDYFATSKWENASGADTGTAYANQRSLYLILNKTYTQAEYESCFEDTEYPALLCNSSSELENAYDAVYSE